MSFATNYMPKSNDSITQNASKMASFIQKTFFFLQEIASLL